jgi:hypothetical protein
MTRNRIGAQNRIPALARCSFGGNESFTTGVVTARVEMLPTFVEM